VLLPNQERCLRAVSGVPATMRQEAQLHVPPDWPPRQAGRHSDRKVGKQAGRETGRSRQAGRQAG
jgi:hypothetical protein